jgi:hypothetical protein
MSNSATDYEIAALVKFMSDPAIGRQDMDAVQRARRRRTIKSTSEAFHAVMHSTDPPQTKSEAIRRAIGIIGLLFASLFPQYALAIRVAGFLWDIFHQGT